MPSLNWYVRRFFAMSPREMGFRIRQVAQKTIWKRQVDRDVSPAIPEPDWTSMPDLSALIVPPGVVEGSPELAAALIAEAESTLRHEWHFFDLDGLREDPIDWHYDPTMQKRAPRAFGPGIDHRDESVVGSIKVIWEKNRHHHLTVLTAAYTITGDERFAAEAADQLLDWVEQNPYLIGVNWSHPLELAIRLITWVTCERHLRGSAHYDRVFGPQSPIWPSIYLQQLFIEKTYSRGSSANNHLIGEMAGLYIAASAWPIYDRSRHWRDLAQGVLEKEIVRQTFPSGLNREMAFSYHLFTLEFFLLALLEAQRAGQNFSKDYRDRLTKMLKAIPPLVDVGGNLPRYGDGDEGRAVQVQPGDVSRVGWLYRVGHVLLGCNVPLTDESRLPAALLGIDTADGDQGTVEPPQGSTAFEDAGVFVLASRRSTPGEVFVLADAGPHGFLSIAAHAHADALSFTLSVGGQPVLIDPGTYAYHTQQEWRNYFRGTTAHNTLTVDGLDQSTHTGAFIWTQQAKTRVETWEPTPGCGSLTASHDGYRRIGVMHHRTLTLDDRRLTIEDHLTGEGRHEIALNFHAAPGCLIDQNADSSLTIHCGPVQVHLTLPDALQPRLVNGAEDAGWVSPRFGVKVPTWSIIAGGICECPVTLLTVLEINHEG
ncbi:MAG: alginate lyase family protein [Anaerolineae bacterium]|nr:alginate lyase family protein [Anaerolineae bacterium]